MSTSVCRYRRRHWRAGGDVTALTDQNGEVVATYEYDEFGNITSSTGNTYNPLRYSGANNAYYDEETGFYKMGVRYYQSDVGRWLTRDDYEGEKENPQSKNRYVYVENNPVNASDSTGYWRDIHHKHMTINLARDAGFGRDVAIVIGNQNSNFDFDRNAVIRPEFHFGRLNAYQKPRKAYRSIHPWAYKRYWKDYRIKNARAFVKTAAQRFEKARHWPQIVDSMWYLGAAVHMVQDVYAHLDATPKQHLDGKLNKKYDNKNWNPNDKKLGKLWRWKRTKRATIKFFDYFDDLRKKY